MSWNWRAALYLVREGLNSVMRYPGLSMAAVLSMAASLLVLGVFVVFTSNVERAAQTVEERKLMDVYLTEGIEGEALRALARQLTAIDGVAAVEYVSKDEALEGFRHDTGRDDLITALGYNPLPASYRLELDAEYRTGERMARVAEVVGAQAGVEDVRFGGEWVDRLESVLFTLRIADLIMGLLVSLSVSFVIGSTIRLTVIARQGMIEIMRVVGATDLYIRTPFVVEGLGQALVAGVLTLVALRVIVSSVSASFGGIEFLGPIGMVVFLIFAAVLGLVGSLLSLRLVLGRP